MGIIKFASATYHFCVWQVGLKILKFKWRSRRPLKKILISILSVWILSPLTRDPQVSVSMEIGELLVLYNYESSADLRYWLGLNLISSALLFTENTLMNPIVEVEIIKAQ